MAFHVYPDPQTAPLNVAASGMSALTPIVELAAVDPITTLNTMFIRVVKLGTGCAPSGPPNPTIKLKANTGDEYTIPTGTTVAIFNQPANTGTEVADATMSVEANDVYLVKVFVFSAGSNWQIRILNNDAVSAHGFTWVVASSDIETKQPWIDIPLTSTYDVLTAQAVPLVVQVVNNGTGPLTIADAVGFSPGAGFALTAVPGAINPNACGNLEITFTGPAAPGASNANYTVTSDDTTALLAAGHNRRVALTGNTRKLEVMLLVDASGSMGTKPDGTPPVAVTDTRWSHLQSAAGEFLDLLDAFGSGSGRFGVARFPATTPCPSSSDIQAATDISNANITAAQGSLTANNPGGGTPMGQGIGLVIGTIAGSFGYFESAVTSQQFNRRWLVLMSDGAHNCGPPDPPDFYGVGTGTSFRDKFVKVITVGYGDPGAGVFDVDHTLLNAISADSGPDGQFLDAGADDAGTGLRKSFRTALTTGLSLDPTTDPGGVLTAGAREVRRQVAITHYETKAAFVVDWRTFDARRVRVELLTPLCELITPSSARADPNIIYANNPRYAIYTVNQDFLRNAGDPTRPRYGNWTLIIAADALGVGDSESYEYEVIFDSRLKMDLSFDRTRYFAGDPIGLAASLTVDGLPITNAAVTLRLTAPGQSSDNFLAQNKVTDQELKRASDLLRSDDVTVLGIKAFALSRFRGLVFDPFTRPSTIPMTDPSDQGVYRATVYQTTTPGTYDFYVIAIGQTQDGTHFRREKRLQVRVDVRPDPKFTLVDTVYRQIFEDGRPVLVADVRIWPRDQFGNVFLIDTSIDPSIVLEAEGGKFTEPLIGNLDGSYTRQLRFTPEATPFVSVAIAGQKIVAGRKVLSPVGLRYVDRVFDFQPGHEAEKGANQHPDPRAMLGDITKKKSDEFVSLGGFGAVIVGFEGQAIAVGGDDDITVFVQPDEELRPYQVEVLATGFRLDWITLGRSPGVTQSFSMRQSRIKLIQAIRITDQSGRTRGNDLRPIPRPGVSIFGVGVRQTNTASKRQLRNITAARWQ